jgi:hypothetical protein
MKSRESAKQKRFWSGALSEHYRLAFLIDSWLCEDYVDGMRVLRQLD